jgi:hypothetical protein
MLSKDFKEFIALLNQNKVDYLVVGGYAVAIHGHPRYTKDLDIWVWVERQNAEHIMAALSDFGFSSLELSAEDFLIKGYVIQLGQPPFRIDILTQVDGLEFEDCYPDKLVVDIEGVSVNFIDLENLKKNKLASGRFQDLADLENLQ